MRKYLAVLLTVLLVVLAFFLPAQASIWNDRQLLDEPNITQWTEEREGFAESVQLTVAEKLMLLRSGSLSYLPVVGGEVALRFALTNGEAVFYESEEPTLSDSSAGRVASSEEEEEMAWEWTQRLTAVQSELRALQAVGALPQLWSWDETVESSGQWQVLYIDSDTQVSFLVYYIELSCSPYTMDLTVDDQTGKILAFTLRWSEGASPAWGVRGAVNFGSAWRDYWGMDSVSASWYSDYIKNILVDTDAMVKVHGDYNSNAEITFSYDGQLLRVPLSCWATVNNGWSSIQWNT